MTPDAAWAGALAAVLAALGGLTVPWIVARLPEPEPESESESAPEPEPESESEADRGPLPVPDPDTEPEPEQQPASAPDQRQPTAPPVPPKIPYAELAARPGLGVWCAVVAGLVAAVMGTSRGLEPDLPVWIYLSVVGVMLGYVDWCTRLLPVRLVAPSYGVVGGLLLVAYAVDQDTDRLVRALIAWVAVFALYFLLWFIYPRGLGYGDVRLSGVLGMALGWLGWPAVVVGTYAGFLLGAVGGGLLVLLKVVDRRGYPFGPFMLVGAVLGVLAAGNDLAFWA